MKVNKADPLAPRLGILVVGILLGIAAGMHLHASSGTPGGIWIFSNLAYLLGIVVFIVLGLSILDFCVGRQARIDCNLLEAFLDHTPDNVYFKDLDSRFVRISSTMAKCCGFSDPANAIGKTDAEIFGPEHAEQALADEKQIIASGRPIRQKEEKETWKDGHETWVLTTKVRLNDHLGRTIGTMGISHDITDRKQAELRAHHLALHDVLTGLPNRALLENRLAHAVAKASRDKEHLAVLVLDLDQFKSLNDSLGYDGGNRVLEAVAGILQDTLRESDTIARIGGDEFAIILPNATDCERVDGVTQKIEAALSEPLMIHGNQIHLSASIGVSLFPENSQRAEVLLHCADAAMHESKKRGRAKHCFFSPTLSEATRRQEKLESDLMGACARDEFVLHYQPFVEARSGRITGMEALLRWEHPKHGLISPSQFIPALERMGCMVEVGRWVFQTACRQAVDWQCNRSTPLRMAVNISPQQLYEGNLIDTVKSVLHDTCLDPALLELELTESNVLDGSEAILNILRALKQIGVTLALDDFGTGWSSLSYLRRFPFDRLKIDQSFARDLGSDSSAETVINTILGLARGLGLACIAEGVETRQQRDYLEGHSCKEMQGFYFSRPLAALEASALLHSAKLEPEDANYFKGKDVSRANTARVRRRLPSLAKEVISNDPLVSRIS